MILPDIVALGQATCQGLVLTNSFYWTQSAEARAWSAKYAARMVKPGRPGQDKWEALNLTGTLLSPEAYPPPAQFGCPLVAPT